MSKLQQLKTEADRFAERAANARTRTQRNTFRSLEQSVRFLAEEQERTEADAAAATGHEERPA